MLARSGGQTDDVLTDLHGRVRVRSARCDWFLRQGTKVTTFTCNSFQWTNTTTTKACRHSGRTGQTLDHMHMHIHTNTRSHAHEPDDHLSTKLLMTSRCRWPARLVGWWTHLVHLLGWDQTFSVRNCANQKPEAWNHVLPFVFPVLGRYVTSDLQQQCCALRIRCSTAAQVLPRSRRRVEAI